MFEFLRKLDGAQIFGSLYEKWKLISFENIIYVERLGIKRLTY